MKYIRLFFIIFLLFFFIGCTKEDKTSLNNYHQNEREINLTSNDIVISNITYDSFNYLIEDSGADIDGIKLINKNVETDINGKEGVVTNLDSGTNYILKVTYSYLKNNDLVQKEVEKIITTANIPSFDLVLEDNYVIFKFDSIDNLINLQIDEKIYEIESSEIVIKDLQFETTYDYIISYNYLDNVLSYGNTITTLKQKEMSISFVNPIKSNNVIGTVTFKTGEKIDIPIALYPIFSMNGKTYKLVGFDKDINMIRSNEIVNAKYEELTEKDSYSFEELYPLISSANKEDVSKIEIWKTYTDTYEPTPIKYDINNDDIEGIIVKTKSIFFTNENNYQEKYGQVRYMVFFYVNDCRYYFSFYDDVIEIFDKHYVISKAYIDLILGYCIE